LKKEFGFSFESSCDCEIILHLYEKFGPEVSRTSDWNIESKLV